MKAIAAVLSLAVLSTSAFAKMSYEAPSVPGEIVVKVRPGFLPKKSLLGADVTRELKTKSGQFLVLKTNNKSSVGLINELKGLSEVIYAEPNYIYEAVGFKSPLELLLTPQDSLYENLWGMNNTGSNEPDRTGVRSSKMGVPGADIEAEKAWGITRGSKKVVIAVIDSGIDHNHPDLRNNIWTNPNEIPDNGIDDDNNGYVDDIHGWNAAGKNGNTSDGTAHGTHCAGTIGAEHDNGIGVSGVMNEVSLMAVKFITDNGKGSLSDAIAAIDYATRMNVDVMSNSWGSGSYSQALKDTITTAKNHGIVFVAAAGNEGTNNDFKSSYPGNYKVDNVISVASHTAQDSLSSFSCFGRRTVHVVAPGSNILSTTPNGEYKVFSGTSMATPHVSGVVGLLLSRTGRLPVLEVRNRLMATTVPLAQYRKKTISGGRISVYNLLTDTRLPHPGPNDQDWKSETLSEPFATIHPYLDSNLFSKTYTFPGAKYVKVIIEKYDTEVDSDVILFKDGTGEIVDKVSGLGENYETDYAEGDTITINFNTDSSFVSWGALIREVKVIY
jgi:thermitase